MRPASIRPRNWSAINCASGVRVSELLEKVAADVATLGKLRHDLSRCITRADALGLTAIAIYLQRALDELDEIRM